MLLLHRHYKIARTETRCHLLLKIRQMATQTLASRDYVLFSSGKKRHTKVLKLSHDLRTQSVECSKLERHGSSQIANIRLVRNATFFESNFHLHFHLKSHGVVF